MSLYSGVQNPTPMEQPFTAKDALQAIRTPSLRGYLVDKSVPWDAVDLGMGEVLPQAPQDRTEFNLLVGGGVTRMVYRAATATWYQIGAPPRVATLPTITDSSLDGMLVSYVADDTNGVEWMLRYDSTEATYKWHYVGGPPLFAEVTTDQATAATHSTYQDLATVGPSITLPALTGDFDIEVGAVIYNSTGALTGGNMSYAIGGSGAADSRSVTAAATTALDQSSNARPRRVTGITEVGAALVSKYRSTTNNLTNFAQRWMRVTPVRVV